MISTQKKKPNPIDVHVGARVRLRRMLVGMSQEKLGEALDLTFQQVQKYEKGTNRIGASRLYQIANILDVEAAFFFDEMPAEIKRNLHNPVYDDAPEGDDFLMDFISSTEGLAIARTFKAIENPGWRKALLDLAKMMAEENHAMVHVRGLAAAE